MLAKMIMFLSFINLVLDCECDQRFSFISFMFDNNFMAMMLICIMGGAEILILGLICLGG